jgi:anti-anti-sigma factor
MHEKHMVVTADGSQGAVITEPEWLAVGALAVRTERRTDAFVLWLSGALDQATSALLDREFDAQAGRTAHMVLDLTGLESIDSSGLDTLVRTQQRASENAQRISFRQGSHLGRLPPELTRAPQLHARPASAA